MAPKYNVLMCRMLAFMGLKRRVVSEDVRINPQLQEFFVTAKEFQQPNSSDWVPLSALLEACDAMTMRQLNLKTRRFDARLASSKSKGAAVVDPAAGATTTTMDKAIPEWVLAAPIFWVYRYVGN
ncbi:MAG: hypothetical protein ACK5QT_11305 [Oligoflexia bacterium]